jgi:hypothetical protein
VRERAEREREGEREREREREIERERERERGRREMALDRKTYGLMYSCGYVQQASSFAHHKTDSYSSS